MQTIITMAIKALGRIGAVLSTFAEDAAVELRGVAREVGIDERRAAVAAMQTVPVAGEATPVAPVTPTRRKRITKAERAALASERAYAASQARMAVADIKRGKVAPDAGKGGMDAVRTALATVITGTKASAGKGGGRSRRGNAVKRVEYVMAKGANKSPALAVTIGANREVFEHIRKMKAATAQSIAAELDMNPKTVQSAVWHLRHSGLVVSQPLT